MHGINNWSEVSEESYFGTQNRTFYTPAPVAPMKRNVIHQDTSAGPFLLKDRDEGCAIEV